MIALSVTGDGATESANDISFFSTALFIALLIFAGITVVDGSIGDVVTCGGFFRTNDIILSFAVENAFPARFPTALIPLSRITSMAFIDNCLANGATLGAILVNNPAMVLPRPSPYHAR